MAVCAVAAKLRVAGDLRRRKQVNHREVISQMRSTERRLCSPDAGGCTIQEQLRGSFLREQAIERYFLRK